MYFNSLQFAGFFFVVWLAVAGVLRAEVLGRLCPWCSDPTAASIRLRNALLLVASYVFYGTWDWRFLSLIALSTVIDFSCGRLLERPGWQTRRRAIVTVSVVTNLGILGFFKYFDFFSQSLTDLLQSAGFSANPLLLEVVLPVGISFYTFQTMGYTIDVYRRRTEPEANFLNFAVYVAFFPQLVAGPIERASNLLPQFRRPTALSGEQLRTGTYLLCAGLFKKVVIADNVATVADAAFGLDDPTGLQSLLGVYAFAIQIYCDFSGYTDIARGVARLMGFELCLNFNMPYFARNPKEFWGRWHISLSTWLRDYLYIPLGGNRDGAPRTYRNLMLTMLLGGLWHGAAWTFVAWGAFHGLILCIYRILEPSTRRLKPKRPAAARLVHALNVVFFFHVVCISWLLFRADSLGRAWTMLTSVLHTSFSHLSKQVTPLGPVPLLVALAGGMLVVQLAQERRGDLMLVARFPGPARAVVYAGGVIAFLLIGVYGGGAFIYFQF
jgi:D-alanyl-lipoteichoic acid acyltransferase DltB (MBOAT superfamily)